MDLSLVVCTRDRARRLERSLEEIRGLRAEFDWELVLVDNGSSDRTKEVMSAVEERAPFPVLRLDEPRPGLARARNRGCRAARGDLVALTDDDCHPAPDYLEQLRVVFARHDVGFIGGRVLLHDRRDAPVAVRPEARAELLPPRSVPRTGFVLGANMAFRSAVFESVGGFDEELGLGTPFVCGDIEFCARASDCGWRGGYFPGPTVYHRHGRHDEAELRRLRSGYAAGRGAYFAKGMLDYEHTRLDCAKRWYWSARVEPPSVVTREVGGALRYLGRRLLARRSDRSPEAAE